MGACNGKISNKTHEVVVTTGEKKGSGIHYVNVFISLQDEEGRSGGEKSLHDTHHHKGDVETFHLEYSELKKVKEITIRRDHTGQDQEWYVLKIVVKSSSRDQIMSESVFPVNRWIKANQTLTLVEYDSVLPQFDEHSEQRERLLKAKREEYILSQKIIGAPPQCEILPKDEEFARDYQVDLGKHLVEMKLKTGYLDFTSGNFKDLEDIESIYRHVLPVPKGIEDWKSDEEFGNQKLAGCNPAMLTLCTEIPSHMPVSANRIQGLLEENTVEHAIEQRRLYVIDLRYLADIECSEGRTLPGPTCLLYVRESGDLVPIAIQLMPKPSPENPVFYPTDAEYTWIAAKMWFNLADCSHHQSVTHLGFTHLLVESVAVCSNRQLSGSHPIYRLLAPHFLYVIAINAKAINDLVQPGGWVDKAMQIGRTGMFNIIRDQWSKWNLKEDGNLIKNLRKRGVDDTDALPKYHYRDDSVLLWKAINDYVALVVNHVYDSPEKLKEDTEIQNWCKELVEVADFKGISNELTNNEDLIEMLTVFIFISSVGHAAANFGQYDEYAFPPNYPSILRTQRPTTKVALSEDYVVESLPTKDQTLDVMSITWVLSQLGTNSLGDFEEQYAYDPTSLLALDRFKQDLKEISTTIEKRNMTRTRKYTILNPHHVPNAISI